MATDKPFPPDLPPDELRRRLKSMDPEELRERMVELYRQVAT